MKKLLPLLLIIPSMVYAKPSPDTVRDTLDYYYSGQGQGAVMYDFKLCQSIAKEGAEKNNCQQEVDLTTVKKGDKALVWMAFMVPQDSVVDNILVQTSTNGLTRESHQVKVQGSIRYRTWKPVTFSRSGEWDITVVEDADDINILKKVTVNVQ